jgi:transposase-like protein
MGRPSKLTPTQWEEIGRRLAGGESAAALAREFGVSQTNISIRFTKESKVKVQALATELAALPRKDHSAVVTLADEMRAISNNLAVGSRYGSATAKRLHELAHAEVNRIPDEGELSKHIETLKGVAAFTRTANEAAATGLALLNANRDQGKTVTAPVPLALSGSDIDG